MSDQHKSQQGEDFSAQLQLLNQMIPKLKNGYSGELSTIKPCLEVLYNFECWDLYFKCVQTVFQQGSAQDKEFYYRQVIGVTINITQDAVAAGQYVVAASRALKLPFFVFWRSYVMEVRLAKNYVFEADILETLSQHSKGDFLEKVLERLALIYEEKIFREDLIHESMRRLIKANERSRSALIFFKNLAMQRQEWAKAEVMLKSLISVLSDTLEEVSYRLELARLYFHYLDEPELAIQVLAGIEPKAGYNIYKVKFMLMFHADEYKHSLEVLHTLEKLAETPEQFALVYFHYARVYSQLKNRSRTFHYYEKSLAKSFHVVVARKYGSYAARSHYYPGIAKMLGYVARHAGQKSQQQEAQRIMEAFQLHDS